MMEQWADYYTNIDNLKKISNYTKYREVVIIKHVDNKNITIRPLKIFKDKHLAFWIERLNLRKTLFDLYISNASVKLPPLPSDLQSLKNARVSLTAQWEKLMTGYDIFADIDIDKNIDRDIARVWAVLLATKLKDKGYKETQIWDTSRGFHILDKGQFNPFFVKELIMDLCCENNIPMSNPVKIIDDRRYIPIDKKWTLIKTDNDIPVVEKPNCDTSIWDLRRIRRCPFSLHSKTGLSMERIPL